jgi:HD-like signal output (HDOD) protein
MTRRKRILFVDDEEHVLAGLENLLRRHRRDWDMTFAIGGEAALAAMAASPADLVVSDMRMPGMDGAELLRHVQARYPAAARIVLSGHADQDVIVRALPVAHQFLSKPCDATVLRGVIQATCRLQDLLGDRLLQQVAGSLDKLPSDPRCYGELLALLSTTAATTDAISSVIARDPALSVKVLQLVNSGCFGIDREITSVEGAVGLLGLDLIERLTARGEVFGTAPGNAAPATTSIQQHSWLAGRIARRLVQDPAGADEAFAAAVVHDVGKLVLVAGLPHAARQLQLDVISGHSLQQVENEIVGAGHAQIGAYLLGVWGAPERLVEATAHHHKPSRASLAAREITVIAHVADAIATAAAARHALDEDLLEIAFLEEVGLLDQLPQWSALAAEFHTCANG